MVSRSLIEGGGEKASQGSRWSDGIGAAATSAAPSAACNHCPLEDGCGDFEVCRIMSMSDDEILASSADPDAEVAELREVLRQALAEHDAGRG